MKTTAEFLAYLQSLDIQLWINGDKLHYSTPTGTLTPALLEQIKEHKAEIIQFLQTNSSFPTETILPVPRDTDIPLSFTQQRLWFIEQIEGNSAIYNESGVVKISGSLKVAVLQQSFAEIVQRHEILRTSLQNVDGQPIQVIAPDLKITVPVIDWCTLTKTEQEQEVQSLIAEEAKRPFDLSQAPLFRVTLLQLEQTEYLLQITIHHTIADFWAINILLDEFIALYTALAQDERSPLPPLPIQYADFTLWQRQYLQSGVLETELAYWKQQLSHAPNLLQLPSDRPRPPIQTYAGKIHLFALSKTLTESLRATSRSVGVTLFMTLLAAFKSLLYRYTGQEDILVGSPIANRNHVEIENLIGVFANTLVLRTSLSGNPSFRELLTRVREVTLNAYAHQNLPLEKLVEELQLPRDLSYSQLFQVMFSFLNVPQTTLEIPGLTLEILPTHNETSRFDLTLEFRETAAGLIGEVEYNTDLFNAETISRMVGHLQTLLTAIATNPDQKISQLPILTPSEQHQLLVEWNQTQVDYPQNTCIHQLFEQQVERTPDAIAVVFANEHLTYHQLNTKANQLAHYLQQLGVKPETLVGICLERSLEMVVGLLGILKAGGAYIPLDPSYPPDRIALMLADSQMSFLVTQQSLLAQLPPHEAQVICLDTDGEIIHQHSPDNLDILTTSASLAYVIYTSGSTGKPKGVQICHQGVVNFLTSMASQLPFTPSDILVAVTSISFDIAVLELYLPLITGAHLILVSRTVAQDGTRLSEYLTQATIMQATPATWRMLLNAGWCGNSHLKILCGGEALTRELAQQLFDKGASLWNLYGPTETTIWSTAHQVKKTDLSLSIVPIGRAIANTQLYILDTQCQLTPIGVAGELHIGGDGLARGYLHRPDLTQQRFIPHPLSQGGRVYKTGDLVRYLPSGEIEYIGRIDNQIKLRGFRIELGEIESILNQHPQIREAVVVVRTNEVDTQTLVAYLVLLSGQELATAELRQFLASKLPDYMIPNVLMALESLPLTPNGKVDRQALPTPDPIQLSSTSDFVPPSSPIEEILAGIWADVLGLEKVGVHNNFFQLGGHSLIASRVIAGIQQVFSQQLPLRRLFELPTIAELAKEIENSTKLGLQLEKPPIKRHSWESELPLSFAQQRLWFLTQLESDSPLYNIPFVIRLQGQLNYEALEQSLNAIRQRHQALQTNFFNVAGKPTAVISPAKLIQLPILDLSALDISKNECRDVPKNECRDVPKNECRDVPKNECRDVPKNECRDVALQRLYKDFGQLILAETQSPFDLQNDSLLRSKLLHLQPQEHILLLTMPHIVADGWSIGVVMRELSQLYTAFSQGQTPSLPELPIQYADFALWQRQWLQGECLQTQISYWREQLAGLPPKLELPTDRPRPAVQSFQGAIHGFVITPELTLALHQLSQQTGSTLFMTLLAAFKVLLGRYTATTDIVVGTAIANRNQAELEGLIGLFVNTLVLRTDLSGNPTFKELLTRLREVALGAYAHQDLPFEQLVEELQPQRSLSHTPLFQVMFVLQNAPISTMELPGLTARVMETELATAKFDLTLYMEQSGSGLRAAFEYNTDLFNAETISRMVGHLQTLLTAIATNPDQKISQLPILTPAEQHQLLIEWNQTQIDYPQNTCIHQLFEQQVEQTPEAIALIFGEAQLTYQELNQKANQLAHYLQQLGVKPETLVGICLERSIEMVVGLLGILKAGGAYIPLDPSYPPDRIALMLADSQMSFLVTQQSLLAQLPPHEAQVICLDTDGEIIHQHSPDNLDILTTSASLAYVIYTSGSTGKPKGVQICHQGVVNFLTSMASQLPFTPSDILVAVTSISFDIAVLELYLPLITGAHLILVSRTVAQDGTRLSEYLTQATIMQATPATWRMLLNAGWCGNSHLKILCGGEALTRELAQQLFDKGASLWNLYGPTETTIWSTAHQVKKTDLSLSIVPIGRAIANTQVYILDPQCQLTPIGVAGELHIGGDGLARGYLHRPDLTQQRFIPHPLSQGGRVYKTGDLVRYLASGEIEYIGRTDYQVKIRGFRIELGEIEAVIRQHPDVREVVVLAREDLPGNKRLVAYIVRYQPETAYFPGELRSFLQDKLPDYMLPSAFVILDALPLTPNGKVDRRSLPAPDTTRQDFASTFVSPRNSVESVLASIWSHVLKRELIGVHDNFFELGGDSILSLQIIFQAHQAGLQLTPKQIFKHQTIAELATVAETNQSANEFFAGDFPLAQVGQKELDAVLAMVEFEGGTTR
ncbi:non-ribosomal peptide synthetase [Nostoc sp. TCL26-01]|uniref:non-ribosomal peptide synthetase n=1 Tax=Nostoc sp. TCL26-01 TaxID=2576904 RepID=UPI002118DAF4|nr:non-ribosomal peptide synthetase [Nostoc sp. TCL26-01]